MEKENKKACYHLPGLFEFYDFYVRFLELYQNHREYFYDWCEIGSVYGAPSDCLWGGGRVECSDHSPEEVNQLMQKYHISARLTLSNSLLEEIHLQDEKCNQLCSLFSKQANPENGVIVHSDLLLSYLQKRYPGFYFASSTTKAITDFGEFVSELNKKEFRYVVPDFRLNKKMKLLASLSQEQKDKTEFLCNECCWTGCMDRKACYENVSRLNLGMKPVDYRCASPDAESGYRFSKAMENPSFISIDDIKNTYLPMGFSNFKIEGRGLGSALLLEFILYYMTKPECQLKVREEIYLSNSLDLF